MGLKRGCLGLLGVWVGVGFLDYFLLQSTSYAEQWWIPLLLGFGAAITVANLVGLLVGIRQARVVGKPVREWEDGAFVGVSGKLEALRGPIVAPFSGKSALLYEYELKRVSGSGENRSMRTIYQGMGMAPCAIKSIRLVGFPILSNVRQDAMTADLRAAQYLASSKFATLPSNPFKALGELSAILSDDDGDVRADFWNEDQALHEGDPTTVLNNLQLEQLFLTERVVEPQAEVTVFGTYRKGARQIDVGSAFENLAHSFHLGSAAKVVRKNLLASLIFLGIFGAATVYGHLAVLGMLNS